MKITTARLVGTAILAVSAVLLAGCGSSNDPLGAPSSPSGDSSTIVVGSQAYYSNEIIAEIYAQALEADGKTVTRQFNIGQRDAYMPSLEDGSISLFPEYTGNLLQWFDKEATATSTDDVYAALQKVMPDGLTVLDQAAASDQDSYTVTAAFAKEHNLKTIADLANVTDVTLGGAPELEKRAYGPTGLEKVYGVKVKFSPTADTTVDELVAGNIQVADVYTADPAMVTKDLVSLEDPKSLFLASHVVPVASAAIAPDIEATINAVSAKLTAADLVAMNVESVQDKRSAADIATAWLAKVGLVG